MDRSEEYNMKNDKEYSKKVEAKEITDALNVELIKRRTKILSVYN